MSNDINNWESQKVQNKEQHIDLVIGVLVFQDRKRSWKDNTDRPSHQFGDSEWDKIRSQDDKLTCRRDWPQ